MNERTIQKKIVINQSDQAQIMCTNIMLYPGEQDVLAVYHNGLVKEFEIKISRSDFLADFKNKKEKHNALKTGYDHTIIPNYFCYVTPTGLVEPNEVPDYAGLIWVTPQGRLITKKRMTKLHTYNIKEDAKFWKKLAIHWYYKKLTL